MTKHWPMVPLGEMISYCKEFKQIDDAEIYKRYRVKLHAQEIVLRDEDHERKEGCEKVKKGRPEFL